MNSDKRLASCALQYNANVDAATLGRTTALLKVQATQTLEYCAREASQILGGNRCHQLLLLLFLFEHISYTIRLRFQCVAHLIISQCPSYLRTGPGARIERIYREVRVMAIGGGSEEILLDLSMRMAKL